jgi:hypothetical protein
MLSSYFALCLAASTVNAWKTFTVPHTKGADDSAALNAALANYSTDSIILFKKGTTYNIWTPIKFPTLKNVEVAIEGNLTYPDDIATVQSMSEY